MTFQLDKVLSSEQLPSLPAVALRVVQLAQQPEPDFDQLVATIRTDQAISGKVLKTANSALFGLSQRVSSIDAAVPLLGATLVRTLVLGFNLARFRDSSADSAKNHQAVWRSSLTQAVTAEAIAGLVNSADPSIYFTAGLLQDLGRLALLRCYPQEYRSEVFRTTTSNADETARLGLTHVDVSVAICRRWGLDEQLIEAISLHHDGCETLAAMPAASQPLPRALIVAAHCADYFEAIYRDATLDRALLDELLAKHYSLEGDAIFEFLREVSLRVGEVAAVFSVDIGDIPPVSEILDRARATLEEIAVQSQLEARTARREAELAKQALQKAESQREELQNHAFRDQLTGAYNRRFMSSFLASELDQSLRRSSAVGFLFLDIDRFKMINDTYGHAVGDHALTTVAKVIDQSIRESDLVIRYGGDEFLVVLMGVTLAEVRKIAKRICRQVRKSRIESEPTLRLSTSVGAIFCAAEQETSLDTDHVIREVDRAMYQAKQRGGNRVQVHRLEPATAVSE